MQPQATTSKPNRQELNGQKVWFVNVCNDLIPDFKIDDDNRHAVRKLFEFAFRSPEFELPDSYNPDGYSLDKGIMLLGPYGTGKTELMTVLQRVLLTLRSNLSFRQAVVWRIGLQYTDVGFDALKPIKGHYMFDELGIKEREQVNWMGNKVNIADVVIMERYLHYKQHGHLSHFTSNLTMKQLSEYLDGRSYDRLTEMCNVVPLLGESRRKTAKASHPKKEVEQPRIPMEPEMNLLNFMRKSVAENKNIDLYPFTIIYGMMREKNLIKHDQREYTALYKQFSIQVRERLEYDLQHCYDALKRPDIQKQIDQTYGDESNAVNRKVCKHLILKAIESTN